MKLIHTLWYLPFLCSSCADVQLPSGASFKTAGGDIAYQKGNESLVIKTSPAFIATTKMVGKFLDTLVMGYTMKSLGSLMATTEQMKNSGMTSVQIQQLHNEAAAKAGEQALQMEALKLAPR